MLVPFLVAAVIMLGAIVFYLYYLAPKLNPKNKAELLLGENRVDEAIVEFKKVLERSPSDVSIHWRLSGLYINQEKFDHSISANVNPSTPGAPALCLHTAYAWARMSGRYTLS